jgi:hypothetical protein
MNGQGASAFLDRGEKLIWSGRPAPLGYALKKCRKRLSIPLGQVQFVELMEGANGIGHVLFSRQVSQGPDHYAAREDGFLAIANAPEVERKLRDAIATYGREPAS